MIGLIIFSILFNLFVGGYFLPDVTAREQKIVNDMEFDKLLPSNPPNQFDGGFVFPMPEPSEPPPPPLPPPG